MRPHGSDCGLTGGRQDFVQQPVIRALAEQADKLIHVDFGFIRLHPSPPMRGGGIPISVDRVENIVLATSGKSNG